MCVFFSQEFPVHQWFLAIPDYLQVSLFCLYLCVGITCTLSRLAGCCLQNSSFFGGNRGICRSKLPKKIAAVVLVQLPYAPLKLTIFIHLFIHFPYSNNHLYLMIFSSLNVPVLSHCIIDSFSRILKGKLKPFFLLIL